MIASLGMYDLPWLRHANDRLWQALAAGLRERGIVGIPSALTRGVDLDDLWRSPRLLLAQTCGYPLMTELRETVQLVATPRYRAEGCDGAFHRAAVIARADHRANSLTDLRGSRLAVNSRRSNTGWNLPRAAVARHGAGEAFFGSVVVTGSHARSVAAVLSRRADSASIDAVTLAHLRRRYPHHSGRIRVVAWTDASPGLPLVTAAATAPETVSALRNTLAEVARDPALSSARDELLIAGFDHLRLEDYAAVLAFEQAGLARDAASLP